MSEKKTGIKILADNRQARFQYEFLEVFEAGLVLTGTEVKSIRAGKINLRDSYGLVRNGEAWLLNAHISAHATTSAYYNHEPTRTRKLLMHKKEIRELIGSVDRQGLTLVPVKMYLKEGRVRSRSPWHAVKNCMTSAMIYAKKMTKETWLEQ
jgi:SsrA-binding protein